MFLLQIVSRFKEQLQTPQRRRQRQQQQHDPPDLRRWSDFLNPFPSVSPGGYKRYYQKREGLASSNSRRSIPLSPLSQPQYILETQKPEQHPKYTEQSSITHQRNPVQPSRTSPNVASRRSPPPSPPLTPAKRSTSSGRRENAGRSIRLSTIHEGSIPKPSSYDRRLSQPARQKIASSESNTDTRFRLRRRQWRLLRTPSIIKDFASESNPAPRRFKIRSLNVEGYVYLTSERSPSDRRGERSQTTNAEAKIDEKFDVGMKARRGMVRFQDAEHRPDSWNTFHSAKSHFSDV